VRFVSWYADGLCLRLINLTLTLSFARRGNLMVAACPNWSGVVEGRVGLPPCYGFPDRIKHCLDIVRHRSVRKPQDRDAERLQMTRALSIILFGLRRAVRIAIHFDRQLATGCIEVEDVAVDTVLAAELHAGSCIPQRLP